MSRRINGTPFNEEAVKLAEAAARYHYSVVTNPDYRIASSHTPHYKASQSMFLKAIKTAYPHMDAKRIYEAWVDSMESIQYYVNMIVRENRYPF